MSTRSITCPTCAHGFAVPADARTAICPKCGRALPILAAKLSFTSEDVKASRKSGEGRRGAPKEEERVARADPAAALGRIPLRKRVTKTDEQLAPPDSLDPSEVDVPDLSSAAEMPPTLAKLSSGRPPPPPLPPAATGEKRRPGEAQRPPRPPPRPLAPRNASTAPDAGPGGEAFDVAILPGRRSHPFGATADMRSGDGQTGVDLPPRPSEITAESDGRTGVDLPPRPSGEDGDGRTGVDLPPRPSGLGLRPGLPPSEDTNAEELPATQLEWPHKSGEGRRGAPKGKPRQPAAPDTDAGHADALFEVESGEIPTERAEIDQVVVEDDGFEPQPEDDDFEPQPEDDDFEPQPEDDDFEPEATLDAKPTSPGEKRPPAALPPLHLSPRLEEDVPDDPTIPVSSQQRGPVPAAVLRKLPGAFHQDRSPSARVRALSSLVDDEMSRTNIPLPGEKMPPLPRLPTQGPPPAPPRTPSYPSGLQAGPSSPTMAPIATSPTGGGPLLDSPSIPQPLIVPPPALSSPAIGATPDLQPETALPGSEEDANAPLNLEETGIVVMLPTAPIEEVPLTKGPAAAVAAAVPEVIIPAAAELAPVSRRVHSSARGHGVALKEGEKPVSAGGRKTLLVAGIAAVLLIVGLVAWALLRHSS
jgi:hypothetical protein